MMKEVTYVMPNKILSLQTTRSWDFLNMHSTFTNLIRNGAEEDAILGVIDTGTWGQFQPVGKEFAKTERPLIRHIATGARWYIQAYEAEFGPLNRSDVQEFLSPRDALGHGTHTASTAVGLFVHNVSFMGLAIGTARGGAPEARIAVYKACWVHGDCSSADIIAAFDDAIHDGVDVISVSLGSPPPLSAYFDDPVAVGSFDAIKKGIAVVSSGGNSGPFAQTIINTVPCLTTVAASTIDRSFPTAIILGNNLTLKGQSFNIRNDARIHDIVYGEDIANVDTSAAKARICDEDSLNATLAKGKYVLCFQSKGQRPSSVAATTVYNVKGIGVIFAQISRKTIAFLSFIPCVQVDYEVSTKTFLYLRSARYPLVKLTSAETVLGKTFAPEAAYFSYRGPSSLTPSVLKITWSKFILVNDLLPLNIIYSISSIPSCFNFTKLLQKNMDLFLKQAEM